MWVWDISISEMANPKEGLVCLWEDFPSKYIGISNFH